jgi:hypothetical protein
LAALIVMTLFSACVMAARGDDTAKPAAEPTAKPAAKTGDGKDLAAELEKAKQRVLPGYTLAYKFAAGEKFRTKVVHLATVDEVKGVEPRSRGPFRPAGESGSQRQRPHHLQNVVGGADVEQRQAAGYDSRDEKPPANLSRWPRRSARAGDDHD